MNKKLLTMGIVGTALKENEQRAPIYPEHLTQIAPELRQRIFLETGYGERFGVSNEELSPLVAGLMSREELFAQSDIIMLAKPTKEDFPYFKEGQILWGWPHCVQGEAITQVAIERNMTMIAWEAMNAWRDNIWDMHIFYKNNELAGYSSILHALQLAGITGHYGDPKRAIVISFGSTARGAIYALKAQGINDIAVVTQRPPHLAANFLPALRGYQYASDPNNPKKLLINGDNNEFIPMAKGLAQFDIIVNCILQDTDSPKMYLEGDEINQLKRNSIIVDVSCDEGMGFDFAKPTSFKEPIFKVGPNITYYAVDHSPSYLWRSATYEISTALLPFIPDVMGGAEEWAANETIDRAIEIQAGRIRNNKILNFQNRAAEYPYQIKK